MIKKIKNSVIVVSILSTALCSNLALAGDDPVNCQTEVQSQAIYAGFTSCTATYRDNNNDFQTTPLYGTAPESTSSLFTLSSFITDFTGTYYVSCLASVPFSHYQDVNVQVCEYTPNVTLGVIHNNRRSLNVNANYSDRDGSVTKIEWWVDGVKQSTTGSSIQLTRPNPNVQQPHNVEVRVTDNDGHTDSSSRSVLFSNANFNDCGGRRC